MSLTPQVCQSTRVQEQGKFEVEMVEHGAGRGPAEAVVEHVVQDEVAPTATVGGRR